jgi:hypothetical protein
MFQSTHSLQSSLPLNLPYPSTELWPMTAHAVLHRPCPCAPPSACAYTAAPCARADAAAAATARLMPDSALRSIVPHHRRRSPDARRRPRGLGRGCGYGVAPTSIAAAAHTTPTRRCRRSPDACHGVQRVRSVVGLLGERKREIEGGEMCG